MKPAHLKSPFTWEERQILIEDRIWYLPYNPVNAERPFKFPGWTHEQTFSQDQPICIEYCSGNGAWIAAKAQEQRHYNWVAVELKFERTRRIWSKLKNHNLDNLFIICGEGYNVTRQYFQSESIDSVFINFPDPWPKKRHAKNRLIQPSFVEEVQRVLKKGKLFTLVTDDKDYSEIMIEVIGRNPGFQSVFEPPYFVSEYPNYGSSDFETLWRGQGKEIRYHAFRKL